MDDTLRECGYGIDPETGHILAVPEQPREPLVGDVKRVASWLKQVKKNPALQKMLCNYVIKAHQENHHSFSFYGVTMDIELAFGLLDKYHQDYVQSFDYGRLPIK